MTLHRSVLTRDRISQLYQAHSFAQTSLSSSENLEFVHKWSGLRRNYEKNELTVPERINFLSKHPLSREQLFVSVGGSRSPNVESFLQAHRICSQISEMGCILISGGVPGIDLAAHLAAIDRKRHELLTIAVLANPVEFGLSGHQFNSPTIAGGIESSGAYLSEYGESVEVNSAEFLERLLQRDRIISAISNVFIAFECSVDSATVDTARRARLQGKTVLAVKPPIKTGRKGVEQILEEGIASPFLSPKDIVRAASENHIAS
nr:DNA-processing protein DprA [Henriciella sp.]